MSVVLRSDVAQRLLVPPTSGSPLPDHMALEVRLNSPINGSHATDAVVHDNRAASTVAYVRLADEMQNVRLTPYPRSPAHKILGGTGDDSRSVSPIPGGFVSDVLSTQPRSGEVAEGCACTPRAVKARSVTWLQAFDKKFRRYTSVASQAIILGCDVGFFAGMLNSSVPWWVTKGGMTTLDFVGLVPMRFNIHWLNKLRKDALFAWQVGYKRIALIVSVKALEVISNMGLLVASTAAAIEGLKGRDVVQMGIYHSMIPLGYSALALGILMTFTYMYYERQVLQQLTELLQQEHSDERISAIASSFLGRLDVGDRDKQLAAMIRFGMDKDTLEQFLGKLRNMPAYNRLEKRNLFQVIRENVQTQQRINQGAMLALIVLGYAVMGVEKYFTPYSIETASINLGMDVLYTFRAIYEVLKEYRQRAKIDQA